MRILTVYAHPDDESFGPASILARWVAEGAAVHGLWFTRGEHGQPSTDPPPEPCRLAELRERDLRETPPAVLQEHVLEQLRKYLPDVVLHSRTPSWM